MAYDNEGEAISSAEKQLIQVLERATRKGISVDAEFFFAAAGTLGEALLNTCAQSLAAPHIARSDTVSNAPAYPVAKVQKLLHLVCVEHLGVSQGNVRDFLHLHGAIVLDDAMNGYPPLLETDPSRLS